MKIRYRYSLPAASDAGEQRHPQIVIREIAPDAFDFEPAPIGDCWLFTSDVISPLPSFIDFVVVLV